MTDAGGEDIVRDVIGFNEFTFKNEKYVVIKNEKPKPNREKIPMRPSSVETKTDFYIIAKKISNNSEKEFKISYKKPSFSFVENKVKMHRIPFIYGNNWSKILKKQAESIKDLFSSERLVNFSNETIKLGWRYEIEQLDAPGIGSRNLCVNIEQDISSQVLWGKDCAEGMRNAFVNKKIVEDSGIPNFILIKDPSSIKNINDVFGDLQDIKKYARKHSQMRAGFIAQNNRWINQKNKWKTEGMSRAFAVWVNWEIDNGLLRGRPVFDRPYEKTSGDIVKMLKKCFDEIGIPYQNGFEFDQLKGKFTKDTVVI